MLDHVIDEFLAHVFSGNLIDDGHLVGESLVATVHGDGLTFLINLEHVVAVDGVVGLQA